MTTGNNNNSPWDPNNPHGSYGQPPSAPSGQTPGYQPGSYPQGSYPQGGHQQGAYQQNPYMNQQPAYGQQPPAGYPGAPYGQGPNQGKSRTPIIIAVAVIVLLLIGGIIYFLMSRDDDSNAGGETTQTEDAFGSETDDSTDVETDDGPDVETDGRRPDETASPDVQYGDPNADPAAFRQGMEDILADSGLDQQTAEAQGITSEQWDMYLTCITDESIQRLTPEAIESISNGVDVYDAHSYDELEDIALQCGEDAGTL